MNYFVLDQGCFVMTTKQGEKKLRREQYKRIIILLACVQTSPFAFVASGKGTLFCVQQRKQETSARRQIFTSFCLCCTRKRDPFPRATKEIGDVCTQAKFYLPSTVHTVNKINPRKILPCTDICKRKKGDFFFTVLEFENNNNFLPANAKALHECC